MGLLTLTCYCVSYLIAQDCYYVLVCGPAPNGTPILDAEERSLNCWCSSLRFRTYFKREYGSFKIELEQPLELLKSNSPLNYWNLNSCWQFGPISYNRMANRATFSDSLVWGAILICWENWTSTHIIGYNFRAWEEIWSISNKFNTLVDLNKLAGEVLKTLPSLWPYAWWCQSAMEYVALLSRVFWSSNLECVAVLK